jgi:hypothetical protein
MHFFAGWRMVSIPLDHGWPLFYSNVIAMRRGLVLLIARHVYFSQWSRRRETFFKSVH